MERPQKIIASFSWNYLSAKFIVLTNDWSGVITDLFGTYQVALDENWKCVIARKALPQEVRVEVSAFCGDLHTSIKERFYVMDSGYKPDQLPASQTQCFLRSGRLVHVYLTQKNSCPSRKGSLLKMVIKPNEDQHQANLGEWNLQVRTNQDLLRTQKMVWKTMETVNGYLKAHQL